MFRLRELNDLRALDPSTADALLDGSIEVDDAPPAYRDVALILQAARVTEAPDLRQERAVLDLFAAATGGKGGAAWVVPIRSRRRLGRLASAPAAAAVLGALMLGGGVAAATGRLPDPAQAFVHDVLAPMGLSVP